MFMFFFFNDTATTEIYTLSLHDALPIYSDLSVINGSRPRVMPMVLGHEAAGEVVACGDGVTRVAPGDHAILTFVPACGDRKSTRLNSSHANISYAVFCLKKKTTTMFTFL